MGSGKRLPIACGGYVQDAAGHRGSRCSTLKSVICVPLKVGDAVIGTLGLYDKYDSDGRTTPFTSDDMNTAEGFASISAIAIDKSKVYEHEVSREQEAREAEKRLDVLFDSVQGGIITLDRDFTIISVNKYIEDWVSMPPEMLVGHNSLDIFHEKIGICPHCAAKSTFETGRDKYDHAVEGRKLCGTDRLSNKGRGRDDHRMRRVRAGHYGTGALSGGDPQPLPGSHPDKGISRKHHQPFRRRDRDDRPGRHNHFLERGRGEDLRFYRSRGDRQVHAFCP